MLRRRWERKRRLPGPTECQPDGVSFSTLWVFRQILDHYGYRDKPLDACYEWMYRSTAPGALSEADQRDYYVRDGLLGVAWGLHFISPAVIRDVNGPYYYGNWGACGFMRRPELSPKPAYVAFATLTLVTNKAKFVRVCPTGSLSLYCLEFQRENGESSVRSMDGMRRTRSDTEL